MTLIFDYSPVPKSFLAGLIVYNARPDKTTALPIAFPWKRCAEGLTEVLTNDKHFDQEGFRAVFRVA